MDLHILIIIACVFLVSLFSLLFINKFFRRKTFEEIVAEKRAMTEKIYGKSTAAKKQPKKLQLKKDAKRDKKQRQRDQQKTTATSNANATEDDSDNASESNSLDEALPPHGLSKTHVEFEPDPEVLTPSILETKRRASLAADKENVGAKSKGGKKDKRSGKSAAPGILINKNEPIAVKEAASQLIEEKLNHFDVKPPKDIVELKKQEKREEKSKKGGGGGAGGKRDNKAAMATSGVEPIVESLVGAAVAGAQLKHLDDKQQRQHGSPKSTSAANNNNNNNNNNSSNNNNNNTQKKQQNKKQQQKDQTRELVGALDKLSDSDTIGVSLLMNLFRRADLNRSEIQLLIDYLLNKQQDMPASHSEWSDDVCQKLKRQLEDKEKALADAQEASVGLQAKLRELRSEFNTERAQMNVTVKAYLEKISSKESELAALTQEMQSLNDKFAVERAQLQAQLAHEKQAGSQDLLAQLQRMQGELSLKEKCLTDLMNATQQQKDCMQQQAAQIAQLEQQRDELEETANKRIYDVEQIRTLEAENAEYKVGVGNLQNALESCKADLAQARKDAETLQAELAVARNVELGAKQQQIEHVQKKNAELLSQLNSKADEQTKEQSGLQAKLDALQQQFTDRERHLQETNAQQLQQSQQKEQDLLSSLETLKATEATARRQLEQQVGALQQQLADKEQQLAAVSTATAAAQEGAQQREQLQQHIDALKGDVAAKHKELQQVQQQTAQFHGREQELLQQLQEQKEKNNDLRMKNWKLIEALQNAETTTPKQNKTLTNTNANLVQQEQLLAAVNAQKANAINAATNTAKQEKQIRELFQRLYPDAVKACAATALSAPFDQWVEQVLATQVQQTLKKTANATTATTATISTNKSTQSNDCNSNHNSHSNNNNNNTSSSNNLLNSETAHLNNNSNSNSNSKNSSNTTAAAATTTTDAELQKLQLLNAQLRAKNDELTKLVTKTSNTLSDLEGYAREQEDHWRSIVSAKEEQINLLQHSNGEQHHDI